MMKTKIFGAALIIAAAFGLMTALQSGGPATAASKSQTYVSGKSEFGSDFAAGGYDIVAYQTVGKPTAGKAEFEHQWNGATWRFASAEHLAAFKAEPRKYAPQYGGYCAYGVAKGAAVHGDPQQWTVRDGKLFLNYDADVQTKWLKDVPGYVTAADKAWPLVLGK